MQKKLLSAAIAGALAVPGAAMADVTNAGSDITVYGKFHASWDYVDTGTPATAGADDSDDNTAVFRNSRLGFKGDEELSNGLKAVWQIETHLDTGSDSQADNTGNLGLRNTYIGLQGDTWGKVTMGRHDTPYKVATAKLDIFSDTIADYNNIIGTHLTQTTTDNDNNGFTDVAVVPGTASSFDERESQLLAYETPDFNGFKGQVARVSYQNSENSGFEEAESWSVMGMYDQGPFFASLAYEVYSGDLESSGSLVTPDNTATTAASANSANAKIEAWKLGLGYTFGNSKIGFVYEDIEHDDTANNSLMSRDAYWAAFSHKFGASVVNLSYGKADDSDANNNDGADNWSIGLDHYLSKRTKLYAIYTDMDNDTNGYYGLNSGDGAGDYTNSNTDADMSALSIGIVHNF